MVNYFNIFALIGLIAGFLLFELIYYFKAQTVTNSEIDEKRFQYLFIYLLIWALVFIVIYIFLDYDVLFLLIITLILIGYVDLTDLFVYNPSSKLHLNIKDHNRAFKILIVSICLFVVLLCFTQFSQFLVISGAIFENTDWFTSTLFQFLTSPNTQAIIGFMTVGALTAIIGKARRSSAYLTIGFLLIILLPIMSLYDTLLSDLDNIENIANAIYVVFQSEGLTLFIYFFIQFLFYSLLISIIIAFLSLIEGVITDD